MPGEAAVVGGRSSMLSTLEEPWAGGLGGVPQTLHYLSD